MLGLDLVASPAGLTGHQVEKLGTTSDTTTPILRVRPNHDQSVDPEIIDAVDPRLEAMARFLRLHNS